MKVLQRNDRIRSTLSSVLYLLSASFQTFTMDLPATSDDDFIHDFNPDEDLQMMKELGAISKEDRICYALARYHKGMEYYKQLQKPSTYEKPSFQVIAQLYGIERTTLARRYQGKHRNRNEAHIQQQRLSPTEEICLAENIQMLEQWNFPPFVRRVNGMAAEIIERRGHGDKKSLGVNWV